MSVGELDAPLTERVPYGMASSLPGLSFFPMLPLKDEVSLGDWTAGPVPPSPAWKSARFEQLARGMMGSSSTDGCGPGAALWSTKRGFDGSVPSVSVAPK